MKVNRETLLCDEQQAALKRVSPFYYVNENCVPTAVFHGVKDELVQSFVRQGMSEDEAKEQVEFILKANGQ